MDHRPIADISRTAVLAMLTRHRFRGLIVAALGAALGLSPVTDGAAAPCRKKSDRCDRSSQCCSNRCRRGFCYPRRR